MYSSHGHHIPGTDRAGLQPLRARCGGFNRCAQCLREAAKVLVESERDHHHILIGLSLQTAGRDQKIRGLLTNAIAWTFFGDENKAIVDCVPEQVAQAKIAAERCMVAMREFNKLPQDAENHEDGQLVAHARCELELLGIETGLADSLVEAVRGFASYGHSGGSASWAIPVLHDLLQYKALSPLTNDPKEWMIVDGDDDNPRLWQSKRQSDAFSEDGGQTYRCLNDGNLIVHESARVDVGVRHIEGNHESSVSGGTDGQPATVEQESEDTSTSSIEDAAETSEEGSHGI